MLKAILHGKKRGTGTEGLSLAESFVGAEDTLTATLFERLAYLPDEMLIPILFAPDIWGTVGVTHPGAILDVAFWPRLTLRDAPEGDRSVEPDIVITCDDRVLVIEAKRFDNTDSQHPWQLAREWVAGRQAYPGRPVWLLTVAGLPDGRARTVADRRDRIMAQIRALGSEPAPQIFKFGYLPWYKIFTLTETAVGGASAHHARLLRDIREGLLLHGVRVEEPVWLADLTSPCWTKLRPKAGVEAFPPQRPTALRLLDFGSIKTHPSFFQPRKPS